MRRAARTDANHKQIVDALKAYGVSVIDTSKLGAGYPDLTLGHAEQTLLMEVKNPATAYGRKGLNQNQKTWREKWNGGAYCVVDSIEAAIRAVKALESK